LAARFPRRILQFEAERDRLDTWARNKGEEGIAAYWQENNASSIDGLPGLTGQRARQGSG
jgi:hypothetical protein